MKRKTAIVVAVALLVGAAVATFLFRRDDVGVSPIERAAPNQALVAADGVRDESSTIDAVREVVNAPEPIAARGAPAPAPPTTSAPAPQGAVIVSVVDATTSMPLPDVSVTLARCPFGREHASNVAIQEVVGNVTTDANGHARMTAADGVEIVVRVEAPFLAEPVFATPDRNAEQEVVLRADRGVELTGRVETRDGKPINGAAVAVIEHRQDGSMTDGLAYGQTDADGAYAVAPFRFIASATYGVRARANGFAAGSIDRIDLVGASATRLPAIALDVSGIPITGTIVGDAIDFADKKLELHDVGRGRKGGMRSAAIKTDGSFEFRIQAAGNFRLELDGYCIDGDAARRFSVNEGATHYDCGILRVAPPSTHYTGRVVRLDGIPVTSGRVDFGGFRSEIAPDGAFDLVSCSSGPLALDISWSSGDADSNERVTDYVFRSTTANELVVQPRGILVRITHSGKPADLSSSVVLGFAGPDGTRIDQRMPSMPAQWRIGDMFGDAPSKAGPASMTLTIDGKPPVKKEFALGEGGLRCPEIVVTFDYAELGLE